MIERDLFNLWLQNDVTKEVFRLIERRRDELRDLIHSSSEMSNPAYTKNMCCWVGRHLELNDLFNIEFDDFNELVDEIEINENEEENENVIKM